MSRSPIIVGLLGGVAAGKTTVAGLLEERGARVIDADRIAHEVLDDPGNRTEIERIFGPGVIRPDGRPDRRRIAEVVFADQERLRALEAVVHPGVRERIRREIDGAGDPVAIVLDAPLLLEGGLSEMADVLVFVSARDEVRRERAASERGWEPAEHARREGRQAPIPAKRAAAKHEIRNDGSLEDLEDEVERLWRKITAGAESTGSTKES